MELSKDGGRVSVQEYGITLDQLEMIIKHFERHQRDVVDVSMNYNPDTLSLEIDALPVRNVRRDIAETALRESIRGARLLYPIPLDRTA